MQPYYPHPSRILFGLASLLMLPNLAAAATVANPLCPSETALFAPGNGQDVTVPPGFKVSVFASGLNAPTGIAFLGNKNQFQVYVLESGHGLPSQCNEQGSWPGGVFDTANPFTPDILVFDQSGRKITGPIGKPTSAGGGFQPAGPAVDIAFEHGFQGGRLFASDSNQATHGGGQNSSSRIVTVDIHSGIVSPFITGLPTGDHPTEQLAFKGGWIYWSQGSTTNSGVVGLDNNGGLNQPDIPCEDITLSQNVFPSSASKATSGYEPFSVQKPGATVPAFTNTQDATKSRQGVCDGATLRALLNNPSVIQPVGWGHRNGYAIRFAPEDHPLRGQLLVGEDGADERGARPSNGAPEVLSVDQQNADGTPVYHGWPDRYGFFAASQAVFNPVGGASDDLCVFDAGNPPSFCTPASLASILKFDVPIKDVLAFPPAPIVAPLALEAADSSFTGIDFVPGSFVTGPVQRGAALYSLEGDFGFSAPNATAPAPEVGHEVKLMNFNQDPSAPLSISFQNFARNDTGDEAFISPGHTAGFNRPTNLRFGPDGCAYVVDYGAVRDPGGGPGGLTRFVNPADAPLVQFPGTGVIFKICHE
jgi:glucose/arabinose dehydrogenase